MQVLVCGSRHFNDYNLMKETLDAYSITGIIHGGARGADTLAGRYGEETPRSPSISVKCYPALWELYGNRAGPIRNSQMLREGNPDLVIAFLAPDSKGTKDMIRQATKAGIEVKIVEVN